MSDVLCMSSLTARCSTKSKDQQGGATIAIPLGSSMGARGAYTLQEVRGQVLDEVHTATTTIMNIKCGPRQRDGAVQRKLHKSETDVKILWSLVAL